MLEVTLLGTGSPLPSPDRAGPATLVRAGEARFLVDCGRGAVMRLAAAGVLPVGLSAVLLTHLHSDHITDLNDVVSTHWVMSPGPAALRVVGPPGTARVVQAVSAMLDLDQAYRLAHHADLHRPPAIQVTEVSPGEVLEIDGCTVAVHETDHRPVRPTVGYRIEHQGAVAALAGDTLPCPGVDEMCRDADLYVQTVVRDDLVRLVPNPRFQDILDYHSTVEQAAETAARTGVRTLVMTHYVPPLSSGEEEEWRQRAAERFGGRIVLGREARRRTDPAPPPTRHDGTVLYTVGHGTRTGEELAALLTGAGIEAVVDIRIAPGSRRHPQFNRSELERWLPQAGVAYRWEQRLGGHRKLPHDSPDVALRNSSFRAYAAHMRTEPFREAMAELVEQAAREATAVMCSESLWWRCHRRLVSDRAVLVEVVPVVHLMSGGRQSGHRTTPGVRAVDGTLFYDDVEGQVPLL